MDGLLTGHAGFLLCSHRLKELARTDRLLVIDAGHLIEDGKPQALIDNPDSEFSQHLRAGDFGARATRQIEEPEHGA
jgi:ABC-type multidrug transport system fused ATPase/permease subunit